MHAFWQSASDRPRLLATLIIVTVLAVVLGLLAKGYFWCWETTYQCNFEGMGDFAGGKYPPDPPVPSYYSGATDATEDGLRVAGFGTVAQYASTVAESRTAVGWTSPSGSVGFYATDPPGLRNLGYGSAPPADNNLHSVASRISEDGKVVVGNAVQNSIQRPMRWIGGTAAPLPQASDGHLPGEAIDASYDGTIIVGYTCPGVLLYGILRVPKLDDYTFARQAVRWRQWSGGYPLMELPHASTDVPSANASIAKSVSGSGEKIVGVVYDHKQVGTSQVKYPVLWWRSPPLSPPPPGPAFRVLILRDENGTVTPGDAVAISTDGSVAVGSIGVYPNQRACYWEVGSPFAPPVNATLMPLIPNDCNTSATCVSTNGGLRIYGSRSWLNSAGNCDYEETTRGNNVGSFVWESATGKSQDLLEYMNTKGVAPAGWVIEQVQAASTDGLTLVGTGYKNVDTYEGWVYRCRPIVKKHLCMPFVKKWFP